jgi:predicted DNA-binding protein
MPGPKFTNYDERYELRLPRELRRRATETAKSMHQSTSVFIRSAIDEKITKFDDQKRLVEVEKLERRQIRLGQRAGNERSFGNIDRGVARLDRKPLSEAYADLERRPRADDEKLYVELARHILAGGEDPDEIRRRAMKAVDSVQRARPLTCPPEQEILVKLEEHMAALKINKTKAPAADYDRLVGAVLNTQKIKSVGEIETIPDEQESEQAE